MSKKPLDDLEDLENLFTTLPETGRRLTELQVFYTDLRHVTAELLGLTRSLAAMQQADRKRLKALELRVQQSTNLLPRRKNPVKCKECGIEFRPLVKPGPVPKFCGDACRQAFFNHYDARRARAHNTKRGRKPSAKRLATYTPPED